MWNEFKSWAKQPFSADMDALHWFYFFGLLIVISVLWGLVLRALRDATE
jgi:hypothetical protein